MSALTPLETLLEPDRGTDLPLPADLSSVYGRLGFPIRPDKPYVVGNMVTTLDGVVSLGLPGQFGGGEISGFNQHDRMLMGLLRAAADAVIIGAGSLRAVPDHIWTPAHIFPPLAPAYRLLRDDLGKLDPPLNVVVTGRGDLAPDLRLLRTGEIPVLIVTTPAGAQRLRERELLPSVLIAEVDSAGPLSAAAVLNAVVRARQSDLILVEGGPRLMGDFLAEHRLDELFLTLAPQIAGRMAANDRPGLVAGKHFAPDHALWGTLVGLKRGGSHLFLRYAFA